MEIHCEIQQGLKPGLLDRFTGLNVSDETVWTMKIFLTDPASRELLASRELARVFGSIIQKIAGARSACFFFPYDLGEVKTKLQNHNIELTKGKGGGLVKIPSQNLSSLVEVLETSAFTTFYAWVGGQDTIPDKPELLFENLDVNDLVVVLSLYDESVELLSKLVPVEVVVNIIHEVGAEIGIQVFS